MIILKKIKIAICSKYKSFIKYKEDKIKLEAIKNTIVDKKTILFESEGDFTDNARVLYEYMIANNINKKYKIIWIVDNPQMYDKPLNVEFLSRKIKTKKDIYNFYSKVGSAKYLFFTHPYWYKEKKSDQIIINLWHGIPLKDGRNDIHETFDYLIIPSKFSKELFQKFIGAKDEQCLILGTPRNDLLFCQSDPISKIINNSKQAKNIIVMTTFKQGAYIKDSNIVYPFVLPFINDKKDLINLNYHLKENNINLIIKIHHLQKMELIDKINLSNVVYIEDEELNAKNIQLYELVGKTDALLTDYSSIMFDYLLTNKPIGYFINDLEEYRKNRGFLVDNIYEYMIGPKIENKQEFYEFINQVKENKDGFKNERNNLMKKMHKYKNDNCKRILEYFKIK